MIYFALIVGVLFLLLKGYFSAADRYNIIDKPNERSSHSQITIRGGGIVFTFAILLFALWTQFVEQREVQWLLPLGIGIAAAASFIDDVYTIKPLPRLIAHASSVFLLYLALDLLEYWGIAIAIVAFICTIGWINTFNFMDGINGITVLYALSILLPVAIFNEVMISKPFIDLYLLPAVIASLLVFGWFNVRKRAKAFAGDVGSVAMALILAYVLLKGMMTVWGWSAIVMVSVYGIDSVGTILSRLKNRENIFEAHRTHLYQYMANEWGIAHVKVSVLYATVQLLINISWLFLSESSRPYFTIMTLVAMAFLYYPLKGMVLRKAKAL